MSKQQSACGLLNYYYQALIHCLPMKNDMFLSELRQHGLLPETVNTTLKSLASSAERASYFLDTILKPGVSSDGGDCLSKLLSLMKSSALENVAELAKKIMAELDDIIKSGEYQNKLILFVYRMLSSVSTYGYVCVQLLII